MTAPKKEVLQFAMHPKLLHDVIKRQAGTLSKAVLEGVMNAIDARASKVDITLSATQLRIVDDGKGFTDRQEIELFFKTFGQPHDEREKKIYGQFRMGRGQLFSFGRNTWRTTTFAMDVDIQERGLDFTLEEHTTRVPGCTIQVDLYTALLPSELDATLRDIQQAVKYSQIPVTLNGKAISVLPAAEKWTHETADAYVRLKATGSLMVYNLGVFVEEIANHHFGTGGVVVSKQQLRVNFARNQVDASCPVWKRVKALVDARAKEQNTKEGPLTDGARKRLADQLRLGQLKYWEARKLRMFTDVTGRHHSLSMLQKQGPVVSVADEGDLHGDKFMQMQLGFVFATATLERFEVSSVEELLDLLAEHTSAFMGWKVIPYSQIRKQVQSSYLLYKDADLTALQAAALNTIRAKKYDLEKRLDTDDEDEEFSHRKIYLGKSGTAKAWTDGTSYIAFDVDWLAKISTRGSMNVASWVEIAQVLLHEYTHTAPTTEAHTHTPEFYRRFHDTAHLVADFVEQALTYYPKALEQQGLRQRKQQLKQADRLAKTAINVRNLAAASK